MSALYNEVLANLSWYQLNSNYKDPMYQYMNKIRNDLYLKEILPLQITNYTTQDDYVLNTRTKILQYGNYQCSAPGKEAYFDSAFSCILFQLPFFLENFQIGYIGFAFILPILAISLFGGIQESYRWFILHQAIWDAFICYDFICSKPSLLGWSYPLLYSTQTTCFYRNYSNINDYLYLGFLGFRTFLRNASFIPVFHLAFSRFLCMYFPIFYKKFTKKGYKIFIFILFFNVLCISIFCAYATSLEISIYPIKTESEKCNEFCPSKNTTYCNQNIPKFFQCTNQISLNLASTVKEQQRITKILRYISFSIPPAMFFLSIICAGFLLYKIASQLKFQLKSNQDSFKQTIKISSVVGFQCLTMSVIFVITGIQKFMLIKSEVVGTYNIYDELPIWLLLLQYYTTTASLNMIRVLLDSCIILTVLTGYSKCVISTFKFLVFSLTNPRKTFKKIKFYITSNEVTVISISRK